MVSFGRRLRYFSRDLLRAKTWLLHLVHFLPFGEPTFGRCHLIGMWKSISA